MPAHHARSKTTSNIDVVGQGKRLSLQFPIQKAAGSQSPADSPRSRPQSWVGTRAPSPVPSPDSTVTETNILAVLAAQERYVLELKEELNKAEIDLKTLKKHYALHEAHKRRNDVRKVAQLQPLNTTLANIEPTDELDDDGSNLWMQKEMERRKALLSSTKTSQRKVFSGSRHLRTLSLLSPDKNYSPSFPQPLDLAEEPEAANPYSVNPPRSSTSSEFVRPASINNSNPYEERQEISGGLSNIQRENIIRAGTQMANDFKNGLFTFIEDIRQATVGDEATSGQDGAAGPATARNASAKTGRKSTENRPALNRSASSKKSAQRTGSIGDDFWKENGLSEPKTTAVKHKTHATKNVHTPQKQQTRNAVEEEDWDNWDTPNDASDVYIGKAADLHHSSDESDEPNSPVSGPGSSRTSTSSNGHPEETMSRDGKRNSIPWPDLVKLSPNNLKRTASHLMKEWEKQLTPPPESRNSSHAHGDYIERSSSPAAQS